MEPEAKKKKKFCSGSGEINNLPTWKSCSLHPLLPSAGQFHSSSVAQLCPTLCSPMDHSTTGLPVHHQHPEFTQTHVHRVCDAILPSPTVYVKTSKKQRVPQFSAVTQLCPTLCDPMNYSISGLPVHHQLLESTQTHVHRVGDTMQPVSPSVVPFSRLQSFPASGSFLMSQFFISGGQSIGVSIRIEGLIVHKLLYLQLFPV